MRLKYRQLPQPEKAAAPVQRLEFHRSGYPESPLLSSLTWSAKIRSHVMRPCCPSGTRDEDHREPASMGGESPGESHVDDHKRQLSVRRIPDARSEWALSS